MPIIVTRNLAWVDQEFFARPVETVAADLIGRRLLVMHADRHSGGIIVEAEAYNGPDDPASHAAFKPNGAARVMWDAPGTVYVYAAYGVYPCLNFVTGACGQPGAVLIRGVWVDGAAKPTLGPGRTSLALGVTLADHGISWDAGRFKLAEAKMAVAYETTPRIGIKRAVERPWRFVAVLDEIRKTLHDADQTP